MTILEGIVIAVLVFTLTFLVTLSLALTGFFCRRGIHVWWRSPSFVGTKECRLCGDFRAL